MTCVDQHRADLVGAGAKGLVEKAVVRSPVRRKQAGDVLKGDHFGRLRHFIEHPQPFPEKAAAGRPQATHFSGERQILAREACPDDLPLRHRAPVHVFNRAEVKMPGVVIGGVDVALLPADVVRPYRKARPASALGYEAATGEKIHERWKVLSQSVLLNSFRLSCQVAVLNGILRIQKMSK